jgi:endonuclease/exonuclease/phosphatase (EEP) superfamily protein YafD
MTHSGEPSHGPQRLDRLHSRGCVLMLAIAAATALASLLALGGRWWWVLDLLTHFRAHYCAALVVATVYFALIRRWSFVTFFGGVAALNLAAIVPLYLPANAHVANGRSIRLLLANVNVHNRQYDRFLQLVHDETPDVILVLEVNSAWQSALDRLASEYPHSVTHSREDSFGIAFLSRLPVDGVEVKDIGPAEVPSVVARVDCGDHLVVEFVGTHPLPPVSARYTALRDGQLLAVGRLVGSLPRPTILAGDLNTTSWSAGFRVLLANAALRDSRRGFGIQPSWPGRSAAIGVPIDHVIVSQDVAVERREVGPDIGSDHRPVLVDLQVSPSSH